MPAREVVFASRSGGGSALYLEPADARLLYVLAHGGGAGMRHVFMDAIAEALAARGVATWRYQFPFMEAAGAGPGRRRGPDRPDVLEATVRAAVAAARAAAPGLPVVAGGKSMGGRMTSQAVAREPLAGVAGLVFLGFPLHLARQPAVTRADHLAAVPLPMLFLQGTRDALAELPLLRPVIAGLGARATLHLVDQADHAFAVPKRTGRSGGDVLDELAGALLQWAERLGIARRA